MAKKKKVEIEEIDFGFLSERNEKEAEEFFASSIEALSEKASMMRDRVVVVLADGTFETTFGRAMAFAMLAYPRISFRPVGVADFEGFEDDKVNIKSLVSRYHNRTISECVESGGDISDAKRLISRAVELCADVSYAVNRSSGNTVNLYDILDLADRNPEVKAILNMSVNERSDYADVVEEIKDANKRLVQAVENDPGNSMSYILSSVSPGQFQQVFCSVGYKPEVTSSDIYPHCVNTSLLRGFRNEMDYYVSAMGARKALVTNSLQVRKAGYLSRKLLLLVMGTTVKEVDDCGSKLTTDVVVTESLLGRIHRRFALDKKGKVFTVDSSDKSLIGKKVRLRSPMTCRLEGGICRTCCGDKWRTNPFHIGVSNILKLTEQFIQRLLSSKHLLQINPERIVLPPDLEEYFYVDKTSLVAKKQFRINIRGVEEQEDEDPICTELTIVDGDRKISFTPSDDQELTLGPIIDRINPRKQDNPVDVFEDMEVFGISVENSELTTPLKKLIKILESDVLLNESPVEEVLGTMMDLLDKSDIDSEALAIEMILRELMRDPDDIQERPSSFLNGEEGSSYTMLKLTTALVNHPSLGVSLAFERLSTVIENSIFKKNSESLIDGLY